ncbi:reverse transcriptase domain-containing protein [Tanacetum coccineum]
MKKCIAELPMVTTPKPKEELIMYLCTATGMRNKLQFNGKTGLSIGACHKKADEVFPSTPSGGAGAGLILTSPEGEEFTYVLRFKFNTSNNKAEYKALAVGLRIVEQMGVKSLVAKVDSRLVANQINGLYEAKEQSMTQYLEKAKALIDSFKTFSIEQVSRSKNKKADALSKFASTSFAHLTKQVLVEKLKRKSIEEKEILTVVEEEGYCWMTPLIKYLMEGTLPKEAKKARAMKIKARQCILINDVLYKKSFLEPWLLCVGPTQAEYVVREIHEGS